MKAGDICAKAAQLVSGDRALQHGDKAANLERIALLWSVYLKGNIRESLVMQDVAMMMVLLKVARTKGGQHNDDNYVDIAGYAGLGGDLAGSAAALTSKRPKK